MMLAMGHSATCLSASFSVRFLMALNGNSGNAFRFPSEIRTILHFFDLSVFIGKVIPLKCD